MMYVKQQAEQWQLHVLGDLPLKWEGKRHVHTFRISPNFGEKLYLCRTDEKHDPLTLSLIQQIQLKCSFALRGFSYPQSAVRKYYMENSRNKQFISFKTCTILSNMMTPCDILMHPARGVNHPFVHTAHTVQ